MSRRLDTKREGLCTSSLEKMDVICNGILQVHEELLRSGGAGSVLSHRRLQDMQL